MTSPLSKTTLFFVDCQTTGATPEKGEIVDLAWCATSAADDQQGVHGGLIQIEGEVPPRIARITGITDELLATAAAADEVRDAFAQAYDDLGAPCVAHYARFEQRFLDDFLADEPRWDSSILCTHAIARRLLPELPRLGIRALSGYFGQTMHEDKRARGHVEATTRIWRELVRLLEAQGVLTLDDLREWLENTDKPKRSSRVRRFPLPRERRLGLPEVPGVYRMLGRDGVILYVGKATSLKSRVNSYYRGRKGEGERKLELVTQVWDLDITPTATPLHAAVLEQREIKSHEPPYNQVFRSRGRSLAWFDPTNLTARLEPDDAHTIGPLPSLRSMEGVSWLSQALNGDIEPLSFVEIETEVIAAGIEIFTAELAELGWDRSALFDPFSLGAIGAYFRSLDDAEELEEDDDEAAEAPAAQDEWVAEDVAGYVRWIARGVDRTLRRSEAFQRFGSADLEWESPVGGQLYAVSWRDGLVCDDPKPLESGPPSYDLASYDETSVLLGELKRLIRYQANLELRTHERTWNAEDLQAFFRGETR